MNLFNFATTKYEQIFHNSPSPSGDPQYRFGANHNPSKVSAESINQQYLANQNWNQLLSLFRTTKSTLSSFAAEHCQNISYDGLVEYLNPALFITMANKDDNPTYSEALQGPDAAGFKAAMDTEIMTLI